MSDTDSDSDNNSDGNFVAQGSPLYKRIDRYYDLEYAEWRIVETPVVVVRERDQYGHLAFLVRRNLDQEKQYQDTVLIIKSRHLGEVINIILEPVEGLAVIGNSSEISPHILYHFLDDFRNFDISILMSITNHRQRLACYNHLQTLISFLESEYIPDVAFAAQLLSYNPPHITFGLLWLIFKPNILVFTETNEEGLNGRLLKLLLPTELPGGVRLSCKSINFDGKYLGFENEKHTIDEFSGTRPITTLEFFPFKFHPEHAWLEPRFVDRGRKFAHLCDLGKKYVHYKGIAETIGNGFGEKYHTGIKFDLKNRVMLDPATFWNLERPSDKPSVKRIGEDEIGIPYHLCNTWLPGFIMEHKKWAFIPIVHVFEIQWANDMLTNVVLEQTTKDLIQGFVTAHGAHSGVARLDDVVPGKGVGLVMLFTGPPGVGKTVTAEAVAEIAHRPLYSISASELGSRPTELDSNLARILQQGAMWNAVLLLDEADVFLEQRTSFDVKRNSLVSIFLRQLEYYIGIIVLTSNRVETFDKALESRVHFNLRFRELDQTSRMQLWTHFLKDQYRQFSNTDRGHLAELKFNGRMIQHAVTLGRSLSKARNEDFSYAHIQQVLDFIDPARRIPKISNPDEVHAASPLDPAMSTTATPTDTFSTPSGANIPRETTNPGERRVDRSPASDIQIYGPNPERGTKRLRSFMS